MKTCPKCNGHGFTVGVEGKVPVLNQEKRRWEIIDYMTTKRRPPTDEEAKNDCVDLEPRSCNCFFGSVK